MSNQSTLKRLIHTHYEKIDRLQQVEKYFKGNPKILMDVLGIQSAKKGTYECTHCHSGRGPNKTGLHRHTTDNGYVRYHCFSCGHSFRPVEGTMAVLTDFSFSEALDFIIDLYESESDYPCVSTSRQGERDVLSNNELKPASALVQDERLINTYQKSVEYRLACPEWQEKVAHALGLPFNALSRPDIGKAFVGNDGFTPTAGDLVTYNLLQGKPQSLKVRHIPGIGLPNQMAALDYRSNQFRFVYNLNDKRAFRMAGNSGELCFGHDTITDATSTVIITEGQSDALAVCAAAAECNRQDITAIGRDSAAHLLKDVDLKVLAGKTVVYCEDDDDAGRQNTVRNLMRLRPICSKVTNWSACHLHLKDARDVYKNHGALTLLNSIFYIY